MAKASRSPRSLRRRSSNRRPSTARSASASSKSIRWRRLQPMARPAKRSSSKRAAITSFASKGSIVSRTRSPASVRSWSTMRPTKVRLRILADKHRLQSRRDTGAIAVHWREQPALALVTFQGVRVLDYRLVELTTGVNPLSIPITAQLAPNFELSVAVMSDKGDVGKVEGKKTTDSPHPNPLPAAEGTGRFHEANSPFTVERDLRVKIVAKRAGRRQATGGNLASQSMSTSRRPTSRASRSQPK